MKAGKIIGTSLLAAAGFAALGVALAPAAQATNDPLPICHSGNGTNWTYIEPDAHGYNGHQHHAADIYGLTEAECLGKNVVLPPPPPPQPKSVALYVYNKLNDAAPAAWENSGLQTLYTTQDGESWFTSMPTLPAGVCGPGWAYQQDKGYKPADSWPTNIEYPTDNIGWPPIYAAKHGELSELITVPDCVTEPPVEEPPVEEPPVEEPPVTTPPTDTPVPPVVGTPNTEVPELALTGEKEDRLIKSGLATLALFAVGAFLVWFTRRNGGDPA